jgi:ABC-type nickel/cobalt efflux system permease component RcnA
VISGLLVVSIGLSVAWGRLRAWRVGDDHHPHDHAHDHTHAHDHMHLHTHGSHSHLPPGSEGAPGTGGAPITWRGLLLLGVSGGLLPCPSALVVMLGAIALQRVGFGLLLITLFSVGLASVLTLIGIAMIYAGKLFTRLPERGLLLKLLPAASAILITVIGVGITLRALHEMGLL